ncbi:TIGR03620 family F420-dependent LLM class oxidoreductase [Microbacterium sp. Marseille-Q6965]|uniref:TIGR03620 family F420-dependent LLM class oxidoreductase n=1 Tax=Microbacterium sp. Marseille-Q6965 TaxID=2965072 RepID=UPI0021B7894A|nr:TIGR03620 family F420-dependent LLM class oxidoreductase [Microbacterium sp. Marseille-Q6965]
MVSTHDLGTYGVWRWESGVDGQFAAGVERLGYGTLWIGGSPTGDLGVVERALDATERLIVTTGIVNIWRDEARPIAAAFHRIQQRHPGRFVLGIGSGHREVTPQRVRPLAALRAYLDVLDGEGVPREQLLLAALGDRTLALAAERTLGAHPYLTVPAHTAHARGVLGHGPLLAPELKAVVGVDQERGRHIARRYLRRYFGLENYVNALIRFGVDPADFADLGSDRLIDLVTPTTTEAVVAGLRAHLDAGADHVSVQMLGDEPLAGLETVARALGLV